MLAVCVDTKLILRTGKARATIICCLIITAEKARNLEVTGEPQQLQMQKGVQMSLVSA